VGYEVAVTPRGPYSLALSARLSSDATRRLRDGIFTACLEVDGRAELAAASQAPDGTVWIRAQSEAGASRLRWVLALDDDHAPFLAAVRDDHLLGRTARLLRGLRPVRVPTVALALLRAFCGQLVESRTARELERRIVRATTTRGPLGLSVPPTQADLGRLSAAELRRLGLHARRGAALVRICRSLELERLHAAPTAAVAARLERERGLGPWSAGLVLMEGLGRPERGLVGDLGLIKLVAELEGRHVEAEDTAALLARYGEWGGLASVYLLAGFARGLVPGAPSRAAA
jgi:3-methyladenine DNA glycosylase/8-oxoguanine DNA glycosylase